MSQKAFTKEHFRKLSDPSLVKMCVSSASIHSADLQELYLTYYSTSASLKVVQQLAAVFYVGSFHTSTRKFKNGYFEPAEKLIMSNFQSNNLKIVGKFNVAISSELSLFWTCELPKTIVFKISKCPLKREDQLT
jgi:hypothetical protein